MCIFNLNAVIQQVYPEGPFSAGHMLEQMIQIWGEWGIFPQPGPGQMRESDIGT